MTGTLGRVRRRWLLVLTKAPIIRVASSSCLLSQANRFGTRILCAPGRESFLPSSRLNHDAKCLARLEDMFMKKELVLFLFKFGSNRFIPIQTRIR